MNKTFAIALAATTIAGSAALADSYILFTAETQEEGSTVQFDTIQADAAGAIEVYDYNGGTIGDMLGMMEVSEGANSDVMVDIGVAPTSNLIALLRVDGLVVDAQEIEFTDEDM